MKKTQTKIKLSQIKNFGYLIAREVSYQCGDLRENKLAAAVLERAILDLFIPFNKIKRNAAYEQVKAYRWIFYNNYFKVICDYAGIDYDWLQQKIRKTYNIYHELHKNFKKKIAT